MKCYKNVVKNVIKTLNVESPEKQENIFMMFYKMLF